MTAAPSNAIHALGSAGEIALRAGMARATVSLSIETRAGPEAADTADDDDDDDDDVGAVVVIPV